MKDLHLSFCLILLCSLFLTACGSDNYIYDNGTGFTIDGSYSNSTTSSYRQDFDYNDYDNYDYEDIDQQNSNLEEKLVYKYDINLQTLDYDNLIVDLKTRAKKSGGYVEHFESNIYNDYSECTLKVRIPAKKAEQFLDYIGNSAHITQQIESIDNMTFDYIDYQAQVDALDDTISSLEKILKDADRIDDLLRVEEELREKKAERDSIKGTLQYIDNLVSYSTFNINIMQVARYSNTKQTLFAEIKDSFRGSLMRNTFVDYIAELPYMFMLFIMYLIPGFVVLFVGIRVIRFCWNFRFSFEKKKEDKNTDKAIKKPKKRLLDRFKKAKKTNDATNLVVNNIDDEKKNDDE